MKYIQRTLSRDQYLKLPWQANRKRVDVPKPRMQRTNSRLLVCTIGLLQQSLTMEKGLWAFAEGDL
ncbi:MAG: hypothetical protein GX799_11635 [Crenarchaeota archaeon]|nr:hypothetical protein [Thermoproteota archaeon]